MPEPRGSVIRRYARNLNMPNPEQATYRDLNRFLDGLEPGWVHPDDIRECLTVELDGARPVA